MCWCGSIPQPGRHRHELTPDHRAVDAPHGGMAAAFLSASFANGKCPAEATGARANGTVAGTFVVHSRDHVNHSGLVHVVVNGLSWTSVTRAGVTAWDGFPRPHGAPYQATLSREMLERRCDSRFMAMMLILRVISFDISPPSPSRYHFHRTLLHFPALNMPALVDAHSRCNCLHMAVGQRTTTLLLHCNQPKPAA